ncbi:fluoride efflux transporter CrcB [Sulfobacillus harzensis]|uniref:Fluoride-specific ion channel FluC n=1 Tax=Sulfobacillus harzensis TaxID=2729629 RepID=A0A7Y0Q1Y9_9FIRM|nr:fluoride efflux transporter CrcB [Sulfobacillus harzensis]NMP21947.1 fluoride efflux transporter CrcB [Sulfobacillus harzensis]
MTPALSVARVVRIVGSYQFVFCINSSEEVSDLFLNLGVVFVGGGLGAVARFLLGFVVNQKNMGRFPLGTMVVNLVGTVIIGVLVEATKSLDPRVLLFADVGFTGAFTTFSSFTYETLMLLEQGLYREALLNPLLSIVFGFFGVSAGMLIGSVV